MGPRGERRRRAREEAARFDGQLTAFGEMLAGHPFATDRPGATHVMAVEYARALDAYEKAAREAVRNPALARQELDEGLAALNRLNTLLVGATQAADGTPAAEPRDRMRQARARPDKAGPDKAGPSKAGPDKALPSKAGPDEERGERRALAVPAAGPAKPRLRDRYAPEQLLVRASLTVLAVYCLLVGFLAGWPQALLCLVGANLGLGMAACGFALCMPLRESWGALRGGRVRARYSHTEKTFSTATPWEQHYVHVDADGRELTYRRGVPSGSLAPLPSRRLWRVTGRSPRLISSAEFFLSPLLLLLGAPLLLGGLALTLTACPGALVGALTGHRW
ncbi:hypothetical protein AQJ66_23675 [Streptomyces bungoensis]|uniref:Uncharacterized protein n=1 Tax=Streptomyces bungoensis TaxID=285568 RepID=A0A124I329_9ACTN|nr:hypothetical protein [Streptomyces bungoensis]KUN82049.1 hypothetical protein AQJ66_23675 [Streptomyces bungoensis]